MGSLPLYVLWTVYLGTDDKWHQPGGSAKVVKRDTSKQEKCQGKNLTGGLNFGWSHLWTVPGDFTCIEKEIFEKYPCNRIFLPIYICFDDSSTV